MNVKFDKYFRKKVIRVFWRYVYLYTGVSLSVRGGGLPFWKYVKLRKQLKNFNKQARESSISFPVTQLQAYYEDEKANAGELAFHYFYQDLHVAQRICLNKPIRHIDVGSAIGGFVAHVASFRKIDVYDVRPLKAKINNVNFVQSDLIHLRSNDINCTDSISCLHALEHFGLGRYGDDICFEGHWLGFQNMSKMLKQNGKFYLSVPLGKQMVQFHAHRIFSLKYLLEMIMPLYEIDAFSYVDDYNVFHENVEITEDKLQNNCGCRFGCAIFELTKK
jgi:hypothetical protein